MSGGRKIPVVLSEEEQGALLDQPNPRYPTGQRNYTMLKIMLDTGLRVAEVISLKWRHIDLMTGKLMVREGKRTKDRTLWLSAEDLELLRKWRERQAEEVEGEPEHVFTTLKGGELHRNYILQMIKRCAKKAGLNKNISPHTLRHTFATDLYRETKNIRLVQKALGHADLSTTMIYTHILDDELEGVLKNFRKARRGRPEKE